MVTSIVGGGHAVPVRLCCNTKSLLVKFGDAPAQQISRDLIEKLFGPLVLKAVLDAPCTWIEIDDDPRAVGRAATQVEGDTTDEELAMVNAAETLVRNIDVSHPAARLARDLYTRLLKRFTSWHELTPAARAAWLQWRGSDPLAVLQPITTPVRKLNPQAWPDGSLDPRPAA